MENSKRSDIQPDFRQYVPVIRAWASINDLESATRVLMRFVKAPGSCPNPGIIDFVISRWIKAGNLRHATSLANNLQALNDANLLPQGPESRTYLSLLEAWKRSIHPEKALNIQKLKAKLATLDYSDSRDA
jgi:hypothetical protein